MKRRDFLKIAGLSPLAASLPRFALATPDEIASRGAQRILVLVELNGGNDGLNTVVPYTDALYYTERPGLAVASDSVLQLSEQVGFNPVLEGVMPAWGADELAVVLGVGYPEPNRSHFRSNDIWETASGSEGVESRGWLSQMVAEGLGAPDRLADGIVLGANEVGPLAGADTRALVMDDADQFVARAGRLRPPPPPAGTDALAHLLAVQADVVEASHELERRLSAAPELTTAFPESPLGRQLETAALLIAAGVPVTAIKVTLTGFDTHANQRATHDGLLTALGSGLAAFRTEMVSQGRWRDVLLATYSEFGRRVRQNASSGTDHGTAAPQLIMGGSVRGGLYGAQPSLSSLQGGDLVHTVDYRSVYRTICRGFLGTSEPDEWGGVSELLGFV